MTDTSVCEEPQNSLHPKTVVLGVVGAGAGVVVVVVVAVAVVVVVVVVGGSAHLTE